MVNPIQKYPATELLLDHAEQFAKSTLKTPSDESFKHRSTGSTRSSHSSGPTIINNYYDNSWNTWNLGSSSPRARTVHRANASSSSSSSSETDSKKSKEEKESEDLARAAMWLCAAATAAVVFVGTCIVLGGNAKDKNVSENAIRQIETEQQAALAEETGDLVKPIVHHTRKIAEATRDQANGSVLLNGAVLLSSAVAFGSALAAYETVGQEVARSLPEVLPMIVAFGSPLVFKVSAAAGIIAGVAKLVRSGYNEVSTTAKEHAMHALTAVKDARTALLKA